MPTAETDVGGVPPEGQESAKYTTRELGRLLGFYKKHIRDYTPEESRGVIRNIQRMLDKGTELEDIATAVQNYAEDEWRKSQDPRYSMPVRTFFSAAKIKEWLTPRERPVSMKPALPQIHFTPLERPKPVQPTLLPVEEESFEL
jgi:hypothetical protein